MLKQDKPTIDHHKEKDFPRPYLQPQKTEEKTVSIGQTLTILTPASYADNICKD